MVFQAKSNTEIFKVPNVDGTPNVYFGQSDFIRSHDTETDIL